MIGKRPKVVCSDSGYHSLNDLAKIDKDIAVVVPSQKQAKRDKTGECVKPFDKEQFKYDASRDEYICPEGKPLRYKGTCHSGRHKGRRNYQADG